MATTRLILGSLPEIDHAHGALAQFLLDLVAAEHGLFDGPPVEDHGAAVGAAAPPPRITVSDIALARGQALLEIAELRVEVGHVAEHRLGLVELALALEIQRQVVEVVHQRRRRAGTCGTCRRPCRAGPAPGRPGPACGWIRPIPHPICSLPRLGHAGSAWWSAAGGRPAAASPAPSAAATSAASSSARNARRPAAPATAGRDDRAHAGRQARQQQRSDTAAISRKTPISAQKAPARRDEEMLLEDARHRCAPGSAPAPWPARSA